MNSLQPDLIRKRILAKIKALEPKNLHEDNAQGNLSKLKFFGVDTDENIPPKEREAERKALYTDWCLLTSGLVVHSSAPPGKATKSGALDPALEELNSKIEEYLELCKRITSQLEQMKTLQAALAREGNLVKVASAVLGADPDEKIYSDATFQVVDLRGTFKPQIIEGFANLATFLDLAENTCRVYISRARGQPYTKKMGLAQVSVTRIDK